MKGFFFLVSAMLMAVGLGIFLMDAAANSIEVPAEVSAIVAPPAVDLGSVPVPDQLAANDCKNGVCNPQTQSQTQSQSAASDEGEGRRGIVRGIRERKPLRSLIFRRSR
jgi:hypothetical protein